MNRVIITGNLTRDIELRHVNSGTAVADFSVAVDDKVKKGNDWVQETSFFDITAFGNTAEAAEKYTEKGSPLLIEGRLKQETWESDGQKRSRVKVIAERVEFIGRRKDEGKSASANRKDNPDDLAF